MTERLVLCLLMLSAASVSAQVPTVGPGDIRCPDCSLTGQQPASAGSDASQIKFVPSLIPAFHDDRTFRINVIARVLHAAPLVIELFDSTFQTLDRNLRVVEEDRRDGSDPATCGGPQRIAAVDLASKPVVSTLRLNDIVTGAFMMKRDEKMPDAILLGTPVLTNVRRIVGPVPFFHATPIPDHCVNRSGRLVEYFGSADGDTTVIYNDGGIYHRNPAYVTFRRERLSAAELSDLLRAFQAVNFDGIPTTFPQSKSAHRPSLTLIGARYQSVAIKDGDARLAPLLKRLEGVAAKAASHAQYILKRGSGTPLAVRPWPYPDVDLQRFADRSTPQTDARRQRVPDEFLSTLPVAASSAEEANRDPNRAVYFSREGRLYRVARPSHCAAGGSCAFFSLSAAEVAEPAVGECTPGTLNCVTKVFPDGRRVHTRWDPSLTAISGRLWPPAMGVKLRDVPASGLTISREEYDRHKEIYFPLLEWRRIGANYIDEGVLYEQVRLCQIDVGADAACNVTPRGPAVGK